MTPERTGSLSLSQHLSRTFNIPLEFAQEISAEVYALAKNAIAEVYEGEAGSYIRGLGMPTFILALQPSRHGFKPIWVPVIVLPIPFQNKWRRVLERDGLTHYVPAEALSALLKMLKVRGFVGPAYWSSVMPEARGFVPDDGKGKVVVFNVKEERDG